MRKIWLPIVCTHLLAISATYLLVTTNLDWIYFIITRSAITQTVLLPATFIGFVVPLILPPVLYFKGQRLAAQVTAIAGLTSWTWSAVLKTITGRAHPDFTAASNYIQNSSEFHFSWFRNGIFWGWPSSHTTVAFAMSVALAYCYRKQPLVRYTALAYAAYIGIGVSANVHWLSDVVAGALIGTLFGILCSKKLLHAK